MTLREKVQEMVRGAISDGLAPTAEYVSWMLRMAGQDHTPKEVEPELLAFLATFSC